MEAHFARFAILAAAIASMGASYRTPNFIVEAPSQQMAQQIGQTAEKYRRELAVEWLGKSMPNWSQPCPITAQVGDHLGAGGATSFVFEHGDVFGWRMTIQGSLVRILDSVLPHEVTHTIFATHFRRPLPRWADEGACTTVEHPSEKQKQHTMLIEFLHTNRGIAFNRMFAMKEYPHDVMPLYSQGYSVARFLVAQGGKRKFLDFLADGMADENWSRATRKYYGIQNLDTLQHTWLAWVRQGSPAIQAPDETPALVAIANNEPAGAKGGLPDRLPGPADVADADGPSVYELAARPQEAPEPSEPQPATEWRKPKPAPTEVASAAVSATNPAMQIGPVADAESSPRQATRPQPIQRPRQVILEWSRPPGSNSAEAATVNYPADRER